MALTYTNITRHSEGSQVRMDGLVTFDSNYPTGGEPVALAKLRLTRLTSLTLPPREPYFFQYDAATGTLKVLYIVSAGGGAQPTVTEEAYAIGGGKVKGAGNDNFENTDSVFNPPNYNYVAPETTVAGGAWTSGAITALDVPRNVAIVIHNDTMAPMNLFEGTMTFTIFGVVHNIPTTGTVTFTSTAGNKEMGPNRWRVKYSTKAFEYITGVAVDNVPDNGLKIAVGIGTQFLLPKQMVTVGGANVIKITKDASNYSPIVADASNNTVALGTVNDGTAIGITYLVYGTAAPQQGQGPPVTPGLSEVPNASNLSTITAPFTAVGL